MCADVEGDTGDTGMRAMDWGGHAETGAAVGAGAAPGGDFEEGGGGKVGLAGESHALWCVRCTRRTSLTKSALLITPSWSASAAAIMERKVRLLLILRAFLRSASEIAPEWSASR